MAHPEDSEQTPPPSDELATASLAAGRDEISMVPTKAVPADAMVRVDKAGTPAIARPVITSLAHSIATCLSIAGQNGPYRQDRGDGGKQSESAHIIPPQASVQVQP